jgi:hypothetical protein
MNNKTLYIIIITEKIIIITIIQYSKNIYLNIDADDKYFLINTKLFISLLLFLVIYYS